MSIIEKYTYNFHIQNSSANKLDLYQESNPFNKLEFIVNEMFLVTGIQHEIELMAGEQDFGKAKIISMCDVTFYIKENEVSGGLIFATSRIFKN